MNGIQAKLSVVDPLTQDEFLKENKDEQICIAMRKHTHRRALTKHITKLFHKVCIIPTSAYGKGSEEKKLKKVFTQQRIEIIKQNVDRDMKLPSDSIYASTKNRRLTKCESTKQRRNQMTYILTV